MLKFTKEDRKDIIKVLDNAHHVISNLERDLNRARDYFRSNNPKAEYEDEERRGDGRVREKDKDGNSKYRLLPTNQQGQEYLNKATQDEVLTLLEELHVDFVRHTQDIGRFSHTDGEHWYGKVIWDIDTSIIERILKRYADYE